MVEEVPMKIICISSTIEDTIMDVPLKLPEMASSMALAKNGILIKLYLKALLQSVYS